MRIDVGDALIGGGQSGAGPGGAGAGIDWRWLPVAVAAVLAVELAGLRLIGGSLASTVADHAGRGFFLAIGFSVLWFAGGGVVLRRLTRNRTGLPVATRTTWLATALIAAGFFAWTSFRDTTAHDVVATGVPLGSVSKATPDSSSGSSTSVAPSTPAVNVQLAAGHFHALDESASGTAAIVQLAAGGRVLTLTNFASSNGPDVRVYLVAGHVEHSADVHAKVDLGGLHGNRGDQQYAIPDDIDVSRYSTVVIFCRSFQVAFGSAELVAT